MLHCYQLKRLGNWKRNWNSKIYCRFRWDFILSQWEKSWDSSAIKWYDDMSLNLNCKRKMGSIAKTPSGAKHAKENIVAVVQRKNESGKKKMLCRRQTSKEECLDASTFGECVFVHFKSEIINSFCSFFFALVANSNSFAFIRQSSVEKFVLQVFYLVKVHRSVTKS